MPITYHLTPGYNSLQEQRLWSHLLRIPGVRVGHDISVDCRLLQCRHYLVTPRRVRIQATAELCSHPISNQREDADIRWRSLPETIPAATAIVELEHLIKVPDNLPSIASVEEFAASVQSQQTTILRDRLVVKGSLVIRLKYRPR